MEQSKLNELQKRTRETKELKSVFGDPKYARQAWRSIGAAILQSPCNKPVGQWDNAGNLTLGGSIEAYTYDKLKKDLQTLGDDDRDPTELEMIMGCQMIRARYDTSAAVFVRDTLGAKPVDESKFEGTVSNPFESLTDEELELIAEARNAKALAAAQTTTPLVEQQGPLLVEGANSAT